MTENIVFAKLVTGEMVLAEKDEAADKIKKRLPCSGYANAVRLYANSDSTLRIPF